jgi:hypothetical protein
MASMVFCRGCGKELHESAPICPGCGFVQKQSDPPAAIAVDLPYTLYGLVPWYRREGFALLAFLFLTPIVTIIICLTGPVYYQKKGVVKQYSKIAMVFIVIVQILLEVGVGVICMSPRKGIVELSPDEKYVNLMLGIPLR